MTLRRAILIYNPRSGAYRRRDRAAEMAGMASRLASHGIQAEIWATTGPGAATAMARHAAAECDVVLACGGDGTLNEILQGMAGSETPLAIWPGGTANVLASDLALPSDGERIAELVAAGCERKISVGVAIGNGIRRYFFLMAGIGLDASIIQGVKPQLKARFGERAFWLSGLQHLARWKPQPFTVEINDKFYSTAFTVIGNAPGYGGGFRITPRARLDEAKLDVCLFPVRRHASRYLHDFIHCMRGEAARSRGVIYGKVEAIKAYTRGSSVVSATVPPWVQVDGELLGRLPMSFEVVPDAMTLLVPQDQKS